MLSDTKDANSQSIESWADPSLLETDGLHLWLDATVQAEAHQASVADPPILAHGDPIETIFDGSGNGHHFSQATVSAQPQYFKAGQYDFLRFDGVDNWMESLQPDGQLEQTSIFIVAAAHANPGGFRAWLSSRQLNANDYQTGFCIDLGSSASPTFAKLNVEGVGQGGERNLLALDYGGFRTFSIIEVHIGPQNTQLLLNGENQSTRPRATDGAVIRTEQMALGRRLVANNPSVPGYFAGDMAEVLVFKEMLSPAKASSVRKYLLDKYENIDAAVAKYAPVSGRLLETIANPPAIQVHVAGFRVYELPVDLPNINNVQYRSDGSLIALAYNGDIYRLIDRDGDGLEDSAEIYWKNNGRLTGPIGMDLTPPGFVHGSGVIVSSKGKCSLLFDSDGDDKLDQEKILASGWKQLAVRVDALGVAIDPTDHSIYFGLGTTDYTNAYLIDGKGESQYSVDDERGSIIRIAPDLKSRSIVCSGIRFPVSLRFNAQGDLFCTDQEGATWLPNGNPFDELLHIQKGRHFGFPPQHPKHLPNVVNEPSVYDYGPQHQSTCGLNFNIPLSATSAPFGPDHWRDNAFVAGYSRGKIFRTELASSSAGYVARNQLFATSSMLVSDQCIGPSGELLVAAHSGQPDWGSGPAGRGKLFKILFADTDAPQPILAWPEGPNELRIAYDRPLSPEYLQSVQDQIDVEHGEYVRAADRFESLRPGYAVVHQQMVTPRFDLPVRSVQVTPDRTTLILRTSTQVRGHHYGIAITRPTPSAPAENASSVGPDPSFERSQVRTDDLELTQCGVQLVIANEQGDLWKGWVPHVETSVSKRLTAALEPSEAHKTASRVASEATWSTRLALGNLLQPAIQPGSTIDWTYPEESVIVRLTSNVPFSASLGVQTATASQHRSVGIQGTWAHAFEVNSGRDSDFPMEIRVQDLQTTPIQDIELSIAWRAKRDPTWRPMPLHRFVVPWVDSLQSQASSASPIDTPDAGALTGSWGRGRKVFFGEKAACASCHTIRGRGGELGPDLSNLIHRDYASVLRDIRNPNAAINPDHLAYNVLLETGQTLTGLVQMKQQTLLIGTSEGKQVEVQSDEVERMAPSSVSIMPEGIDKLLSPRELDDLMAYLTGPAPTMPSDLAGAPQQRTQTEVEIALQGGITPVDVTRQLEIVLIDGPKDHGPGEHDYPAWKRAWKELFLAAENVQVKTATNFPSKAQFETADALVFYQRGTWNRERQMAIDEFLSRGGGVSYIHFAVDGGDQVESFAERIGLAVRASETRFRHGPLTLTFPEEHPITRNFSRLKLVDESYWNLVGDPANLTLLGNSYEEERERPQLWIREQGAGRVFVSIPGHYSWTFDDPMFRILLLRGIAWTTRESVDRFNELVTAGISVGRE